MHYLTVMTMTASLVVLGAARDASASPQAAALGAPQELGPSADAPAAAERTLHIVGYTEPPLASYDGSIPALSAPPRTGVNNRLDVRAPAAMRYANHLRMLQESRLGHIASLLGRPVRELDHFQHAFNGSVLDLTEREAAVIAGLPDVRLVERYAVLPMDTDAGPALIGAPAVWQNGQDLPPDSVFASGFEPAENPPPAAQGSLGEGIIIGVIDSGINFNSPAFFAVDGTGYEHVNPLGAGVHLGTCAPGQPDDGNCNAKLFAAYDFVYSVVCAPANPATDPCGATVNSLIEEPSATDNNSHGSHTASTAAGNQRTAVFRDLPVRISGVAPRANVIAYDACYTQVGTGLGLCPNVSTLAATNKAVEDGLVDVINYSIGGGTSPWEQANSLAFLAAVDAGIFVSTSAGNSGPGAGTVGHLEPWAATSAASTHGRAGFEFHLEVTGPGAVGPQLSNIFAFLGSAGAPFSAGLPAGTPLIVSPAIDTGDDGCTDYADDVFSGAIALIRRGACSFVQKATNAEAAGAIAVVIANDQPGVFGPGGSGAALPVFMVTQQQGNAIRDFSASAGGAIEVQLHYPPVPLPGQADVMADFSSRGPSNLDLVKPDMAAPGVDILATIAGGETALGLISGTSMASPHSAGAAALLRDMNPFWSPAEIKSALAMTAVPAMVKEDGVTPSDPFDRGSGRIRVDLAARTGLVMNEGAANYYAADPSQGGDPSTLNVPSMAKASCIETCTFVRRFRNTRGDAASWTASVAGLDATVTPASFTVIGHGQRTLSIEVDTSALAADGSWHFGTLVLTPGEFTDSPTLSLPIAVAVPPPAVGLDAETVAVTVATGASGAVEFELTNLGGPSLVFDLDSADSAQRTLLDQRDFTTTSGWRSSHYLDFGIGQFAADDLAVAEATTISAIVTDGFTLAEDVATAAQLTWTLYAEAAGLPSGHPEDGTAVPVWQYSAAPGAPGVSTLDNVISLDLVAAGEDLTIPAGTYWLVVHADTSFANRWVWYSSNLGGGSAAHAITPSSEPPGDAWVSTGTGLSMAIDALASCGAPWISATTPVSGTIAPGQSETITVSIDATDLAAGDYEALVCVASNDPNRPVVPVALQLTVTD